MTNIAIYTLTSELHNAEAVNASTKRFLESLGIDYDFRGSDYSDFGTHALDLIYVRTGGTEGIFRRLLPQLQMKTSQPIRLLTSGQSNSLAASMEILSYLRQQGLRGEIIHGKTDYMTRRLELLARVGEACRLLQGCRLGIVGLPSDWLISSHADRETVRRQLGVELVDIPMQELLDLLATVPETMPDETCDNEHICRSLPGAQRIYVALKKLVDKYGLQGFTIRCFDLLTSVRNTGCLALAKLNAEGYVAGCEGDVPAMLSMMLARVLTGVSGFQANPSAIDPETGEIMFAHCTIPLDMVEHYELDTHFESGIGVAIRGYIKEGPVTILKVAGDLSRCFIEEGTLMATQAKPDLCRTQQVIKLANPLRTSYFLTEPIGNHHIIVPGHCAGLLKELLFTTAQIAS